MAGSVNKAILIGRLGKDPDLQFIPSGRAVCKFSMATSRKWNQDGEWKERTTWHNIVMWGKMAENASNLLAKGKQVYVEGEIDNRSYTDKDGNKKYTSEVIANNFQVLESQGQQVNNDHNDSQPGANEYGDIPF